MNKEGLERSSHIWNSYGRNGENFDHLPHGRRDALLAEIWNRYLQMEAHLHCQCLKKNHSELVFYSGGQRHTVSKYHKPFNILTIASFMYL